MKLIVKSTCVIQRYYDKAGTTIEGEKFTPLSPGVSVDYNRDEPYLLLGVDEYSDYDYARKIDYAEVEEYSLDGVTFIAPPSLYSIYEQIVANIQLQAISLIA
jgi:hypothetical protein